ncbi:TlpA family protein disulfide reductase [Methylobacter sp.]|uniref:TlpA family protein disulfide reductase n=1 Tax=Methylobacter sp. TaxID=2051955 RepID=UPI003DA4AC64
MNQRILTLFCAMLALGPIQTAIAAETGSKAPDCTLTSIGDGKSYNLQQFHGKVLYIDFWASWCPPCLKSFPFLNELEQDLKEQGLQVIAINLDESSEDAQAFLAKTPAQFIVATDSNEQCARSFDVKAMPSSYLIDRNGVIRHVQLGFRQGEAKELRTLAEQLLTENPDPK